MLAASKTKQGSSVDWSFSITFQVELSKSDFFMGQPLNFIV